ncbi:hypothetical protein [Adhaeribacter pallidiroseus]|uniref:DUF4386 domain-containing protein n=1 Tax=Adhaeribacter pallidiroseus TaxID=2072847 RepID=A0A369QGH1_9BACT|nr:hypothetical protein [Adhaeribacter pallidiroseus]RDC62645.1 hypothetical protein AHMF7616_01239 [Adhaeribacter pallidiroseus]
MKQLSNYKQMVGLVTVLAGVLSAACLVLGAYAVEYNFEAFSDPTLVLNYAHNYRAAYWFLILDMAGYYLLLLPVIFYLHQQYKFHSPWVPLFTFSGLAYVLVGAIGAGILAAAWPTLMQQYESAPKVNQDFLEPLFATVTNMVTVGLWNILEVLFAATWWIGFGMLLRRDNKVIGLLAIVAGVACLLDSVGTMFGAKLLAEVGVNVYLVMGIIWPIVLGIHLLRQSLNQATRQPVKANALETKAELYV